ncbi:MAG: hypothetical protein ACR2KV_00655 [Solirubrobacteraceae bacterium]
MKHKLDTTKHSMKMWGCVIFAVLAIIFVANGVGGGAFFLIPCMIMMGAMMWMMMGGTGGQRRGGGAKPGDPPTKP